MLILGSLILLVGGVMMLVFTKYKLFGLVCVTIAAITLSVTWAGLEAAARQAGAKYAFSDFISHIIHRLRGIA